ncbi:MAG: FUSC family protein [Betaproteobacteria bacterium]|nr:FUSC family protein [Betaproteobacteria bacterium]MDE2622458.1 FUSC family protein [Betaproteobacteria bacterium]
MSTLQALARSAWRDWAREDAPVLTHVARVLIAGMLALWVSLLFDLEQPRTALITVTIVMQAHSGMVLTKSYYRLVGTVAGILVSLVLVALFAQDRIPFLISMALWIGLCTAGSVILRDHQSYAFVLAGYTLCLVGLPATVHPEHAFDIAMNRVSEIVIGLACATVVSDLVLPRRMGSVMRAAVRNRFMDFSALLASTVSGNGSYKQALARLMSDIFRLESLRASAVLESDESRSLRMRFGQLNMAFMEVSTTFHAVEELFRRLQENGRQDTVDALRNIYRKLWQSLLVEGRVARTEQEAATVAAQVATLLDTLEVAVAAERRRALPDATDFDAGAELLRRLAGELRFYADSYAALSRTGSAAESPALGLHFDPVTAALAGVRGALMLAIMSSLWIVTAWNSGIEAITLAVVSSTLFATSPSPSRTIRQFLVGAVIGTILSYWTSFHLLTQAQGFLMLALAIAPGMALAASLTSHPERAVMGAGAFILFLTHLGFGTAYEQNPLAFMNDVLADFLGLLCAALLYELIDLEGSHWSRRRTIASLRRLVSEACRAPMSLRREKLEIGARDLVYRSGSLRRVSSTADQPVIDWLLTSLEVGHTVIALREELSGNRDQDIRQLLLETAESVARLFDAPGRQQRDRAIQSIDSLESHLALNAPELHQKVKVHLHLLKNALLDGQSVLITAGDQ